MRIVETEKLRKALNIPQVTTSASIRCQALVEDYNGCTNGEDNGKKSKLKRSSSEPRCAVANWSWA